MQTIDKAMKSASVEGGDFRAALKDAVTAHNSAVHRITNAVPSDIMYGRLLRRALPLTRPATYRVNDDEIRERDWEGKQRAKEREDGKRKARESRILVGDTVVIKRAAKRKGETNYDPEELEVIAKRRGELTMRSQDGNEVKRHITLTKKMPKQSERDLNATANKGANSVDNDTPAVKDANTRPKRNTAAQNTLVITLEALRPMRTLIRTWICRERRRRK